MNIIFFLFFYYNYRNQIFSLIRHASLPLFQRFMNWICTPKTICSPNTWNILMNGEYISYNLQLIIIIIKKLQLEAPLTYPQWNVVCVPWWKVHEVHQHGHTHIRVSMHVLFSTPCSYFFFFLSAVAYIARKFMCHLLVPYICLV